MERRIKSAFVLAAALAIATGYAALPSIISATSTGPVQPSVRQQLKASTPSARAGSTSRTHPVDQTWLGRAVHSSDGKYLGDVAALNEDDQLEFYVDLGGFLALGETRIISISSHQLQEVADDRIVLRLTELEAMSLPAPDIQQAQDL